MIRIKNSIKDIEIFLKSVYALFLSLFIKRNKKWVAAGAWCGNLFADNSKYIVEYMLKENYIQKGYTIVWVGNKQVRDSLPPDVKYVKLNSIKSIHSLLKCKYIFFSQYHTGDTGSINLYRGAKLIFLDHGIGVKKWAMDAVGYHGEMEKENMSFVKRTWNEINGYFKSYDYFVTSSPFHKSTYFTSNAHKICDKTVFLESGTPRNDILVNYDKNTILQYKQKFSRLIGFDINASVVLYLPTFRRKTPRIKSLISGDKVEQEKLLEILNKHNAVLIEKNHYAANIYKCNRQASGELRLIKLNVDVDLQELLLITDVQISDYSGSFIDYLLLNRPIIHYAYDYVDYRDNDSGLYLEIEDFACGPVVDNHNDLCKALDEILSGKDEYENIRSERKKFFLEYEKGKACEIICHDVLEDD